MDFNRKKIFKLVISLILAPLILWLFVIWFIGLADIDKLIQVITNPLLFLGFFISFLIFYLMFRGPCGTAEQYILAEGGISDAKARRSVTLMTAAVITASLCNVAVTPALGSLNIFQSTAESASAYLIGFFTFLLCSLPFIISIGNYIEECTGPIKSGDRHILGIKARVLIVLMVSIVCVGILVVLSVYVLQTCGQHSAMYIIVRILALAPIATIIIYVSFSSFLNRMILQLKGATDFSIELQKGRLQGNLELYRRDELGILGNALEGIKENLMSIIQDVQEAVNELADSISSIAGVIDGFTGHAHNQAASVEQIFATTEEVTAESEAISSMTVEQLGDTEDLKTHIEKLYDLVGESKEAMEKAMEVKSRLTDNTGKVQKSVTATIKTMTNAVESSDRVMNALQMITDISEKIALLSLNASIEAARAGESGLGFAVVAEEIGKLADNTTENTKSINELLSESNTEIHGAMAFLKESTIIFESLLENISQFGDYVERVNTLSKEDQRLNRLVLEKAGTVKDSVEKVQTASSEQKIAMNDVLESINSVSESVQSIAGGSDEIHISIGKINELAEKLRNKIGYFTLEKN